MVGLRRSIGPDTFQQMARIGHEQRLPDLQNSMVVVVDHESIPDLVSGKFAKVLTENFREQTYDRRIQGQEGHGRLC